MTFSGFALPGAARLVYGLILTGDQYLHCEVTRERLYREHGGRAIEMEGGAVAQVCERFSVSWLIVRALSDLAGSAALTRWEERRVGKECVGTCRFGGAPY